MKIFFTYNEINNQGQAAINATNGLFNNTASGLLNNDLDDNQLSINLLPDRLSNLSTDSPDREIQPDITNISNNSAINTTNGLFNNTASGLLINKLDDNQLSVNLPVDILPNLATFPNTTNTYTNSIADLLDNLLSQVTNKSSNTEMASEIEPNITRITPNEDSNSKNIPEPSYLISLLALGGFAIVRTSITMLDTNRKIFGIAKRK